MAVGTSGQLLHDGPALRLVKVAKAPFDHGKQLVRQWLDDALFPLCVLRHQGNVAIEERSADRIGGGLDGHLPARDGPGGFGVAEAGDDY